MAGFIAFRNELRNRCGRRKSLDDDLNNIIRRQVRWLERNFNFPYMREIKLAEIVADTDGRNPSVILVVDGQEFKSLREVFLNITITRDSADCWIQVAETTDSQFFVDMPDGDYQSGRVTFWKEIAARNRQLILHFDRRLIPGMEVRAILDIYSNIELTPGTVTDENDQNETTHPILDIAEDVLMYRCVIDGATILRDQALQDRNVALYDSAIRALHLALQDTGDPAPVIGSSTYGARGDVRHGLDVNTPRTTGTPDYYPNDYRR